MFAALRNRVCARREAPAAWMLFLTAVSPSRRFFESFLTLLEIVDCEMNGSFPLWARSCAHLSVLHESLCSLICPAATQSRDGGDASTKRALLAIREEHCADIPPLK